MAELKCPCCHEILEQTICATIKDDTRKVIEEQQCLLCNYYNEIVHESNTIRKYPASQGGGDDTTRS